jgi:hypothetical protein
MNNKTMNDLLLLHLRIILSTHSVDNNVRHAHLYKALTSGRYKDAEALLRTMLLRRDSDIYWLLTNSILDQVLNDVDWNYIREGLNRVAI